MIDWVNVFFGTLWVTGFSLILSAFSIAEYKHATTQVKWRELFALRQFQIVTNIGLMLVCFGFMGQAEDMWRQIVWGILGVAFIYYAFSSFRLHR